MIQNVKRLRVTMQQMERFIRALDDLKRDVLPKNPQLFAVMSEAPLDEAAFETFERYVRQTGLPRALYVDRDSIDRPTRDSTVDENLAETPAGVAQENGSPRRPAGRRD